MQDATRRIINALLSSSTSKLGALKCDAFDLPVGVASLNLSNKRIGQAAVPLLAGVMKFNAVLTTLNLNSNDFGVEGGKALEQALRVNAVLTSLNLNDNKIGKEGGIAMAEALRVNAVLNANDRLLNVPRNAARSSVSTSRL